MSTHCSRSSSDIHVEHGTWRGLWCWSCNVQEVPARFVNAHGMAEQLQDVVELQGVHQESPVRTVACQWTRHENRMRLYFTTGWSEFAKENGLKVGQELEFTLTSESFFVVRVVVWGTGCLLHELTLLHWLLKSWDALLDSKWCRLCDSWHLYVYLKTSFESWTL